MNYYRRSETSGSLYRPSTGLPSLPLFFFPLIDPRLVHETSNSGQPMRFPSCIARTIISTDYDELTWRLINRALLVVILYSDAFNTIR